MVSKNFFHKNIIIIIIGTSIFSLINLVALLLLSKPPIEGLNSYYAAKIIAIRITSFSAISAIVILIIFSIVFLFRKPMALSLVPFVTAVFMSCMTFSAFYLFATGMGFYEEGNVYINDNSYRLISTGEPDGLITNYALCECDRNAIKCKCHRVYTQLHGIRDPKLTVNDTNQSINIQFEDNLACSFNVPLQLNSRQSLYGSQVYFECSNETQ